MSEHEARAVYDHEAEDGHATGRRRTVADWGVGEEIFDRMPRRRFRPSDAQRRGDAHRGGRFEPRLTERDEPPVVERDEPRVVERDEPRVAGRDEPRVYAPREVAAPHDTAALEADVTAGVEALDGADTARVEAQSDDFAPPLEGRRTVVIRGRGAEPAWTPRRRPPRTVGERLGPRPDRLAAWAVALGMLLILIAVLTAHG